MTTRFVPGPGFRNFCRMPAPIVATAPALRVSLRGVGRTFPAPGGGVKPVLRDIDIDIRRGEFIALLALLARSPPKGGQVDAWSGLDPLLSTSVEVAGTEIIDDNTAAFPLRPAAVGAPRRGRHHPGGPARDPRPTQRCPRRTRRVVAAPPLGLGTTEPAVR